MKNVKRIFIISIILVGSAVVFRYWALHQFDLALSNLDTKEVSVTAKQNTQTEEKIEEEKVVKLNTPELNFLFPTKGTDLYMGCTYKVTLQDVASSSIAKIKASLVDAGTGKPLGPVTSGLSAEYENITTDINWAVGNFWPGEYKINISYVSDPEKIYRSERFNVMKFQNNLTKIQKEDLCKKTGWIL